MAGSKATVRVDNHYTSTFPITIGVRQVDALPSVLFGLVSEAVLQKINITSHRNKKHTNSSICRCVAIVGRNKNALKDTLVNIESEARKRGLRINENKTKYVEVTRASSNSDPLRCGKYVFEHVNEFNYLGSQLNQTNSTSSEIQARILSGNRCYYAYGKLMKSRELNRSSKLKIYTSLIRPIVTYGCEVWTLTNRDEKYLRIFERRILRKIFGPVQNEDGFWRIRMNYELNDLIKNADIVRFVKSKRMVWLGHVMQMEGKRIPKRVVEWKPTGRRKRGRPRKRWIEDI
jgi:hypothetical protein